MAEDFEIGVTTIEVFTTDGQVNLKDCDPKEWKDYQEYAEELAFCGDVVKTRFTHMPKRIEKVYINDDFEDLGKGQFQYKTNSEIVNFTVNN